LAALFKSNKQTANTWSSTESELILVDDALQTVQWTGNFMLDQGYDMEIFWGEEKQTH
jgi:hypothetical protein